MGETMKRAEQLLDQYDVPKHSTVHYAFHKTMGNATKRRHSEELVDTVANHSSVCRKKTHRVLAFPVCLDPIFETDA